MISICIPVYNFDVRSLVKDLHRQCINTGILFEICLWDDASDKNYRHLNREIASLEFVRYEELSYNIGRSSIRNLLASVAMYPYLIFMDCDSACPDQRFVQRYLDFVNKHPAQNRVVCGGTKYESKRPDTANVLHWTYGSQREVSTASSRNIRPNHSFTSHNFLVSKELILTSTFNEAINGYGHEDTLLGYDLMKKGVRIYHIDNPLLHLGLNEGADFLLKTRDAIENLLKIHNFLGEDPLFADMVKLLGWFVKIRNWRLSALGAWFFAAFRSPMEKQLLGTQPLLWVLDVYKLTYMCKVFKKTIGE